MSIEFYEPGVREALDKVFALGEADGNEHAIIVRGGKLDLLFHGDSEGVDFRGEPTVPGDVLVHNHPQSLNALSNVDVLQTFNRELRAVYAISADRSVYKAQRAMKLHPAVFMDVSGVAAMIVEHEAVAHGELRLRDVADGRNGPIGVGHWINRMMHDRGIIHYSFELGAETEKRVNELDARINFPWAHVGK